MSKSIIPVIVNERSNSFRNNRFEITRVSKSFYLHDNETDLDYKLESNVCICGDNSGLKVYCRTHKIEGPNGEIQLVREPAFLVAYNGCSLGVLYLSDRPWKVKYESLIHTERGIRTLRVIKGERKESDVKDSVGEPESIPEESVTTA